MIKEGEQEKAVSEPTVRRLPVYHRLLKELQTEGWSFVSCTDIGEKLVLDPTQVRKDLEVTGVVGKPKVGYVVPALIDGIEQFLGFKTVNEACLVGVGNLGAALLGYRKFQEYGMDIVAVFDNGASKVGGTIHGKPILPISKFSDLARRMHLLIGIITVPAPAAQEVADVMVKAGIRAIWNFAPIRLRVPGEIILHNEDLYCSLASLSQKLSQSLHRRAGQIPGANIPACTPG
jgi:redox-sensing transcriptional repressor